MIPSEINDCSRLCVHTITTRPWSIDDAIRAYTQAEIGGITVWRDCVADHDLTQVGRRIRSAGLDLVSYVRGGFFTALDAAGRQQAIDENKRIIDEAAALGAPLIVLVCGAEAGQPLATSRAQIMKGLEAVVPHAEAAGVKLGIEPLHPMYADSRSAINTLTQANTVAETFASPVVGVVVDVYHLWWDPTLEAEIERCGRNGHLFAFHICDWKTPTVHLLMDRGLMGEGCIPLRKIRGWVEQAGFGGYIEVEIFSDAYWQQDQHTFLNQVKTAYLKHA